MPGISTHDTEADARNADLKIYLDGGMVDRDQAKVSVYDSGFLLGDGVWEGIRLHNAKWAFLEAHLDRLFEAAKAIDLDIGLDRAGVKAALDATAATRWQGFVAGKRRELTEKAEELQRMLDLLDFLQGCSCPDLDACGAAARRQDESVRGS